MGLDMSLYKMKRYKDATYHDMCAVEGYLEWLNDKAKDASFNHSLEEWCGISESQTTTTRGSRTQS